MPSLTIVQLAQYLGRESSVLLADPPFKDWIFTKSIETDLEEPRIDYVFAHNGMDFVCDADETVRSIFLYSEELRCFKETVQDLPFGATRQEVMARFGSPSKSGGSFSDPILGKYGAWDRFARGAYAIHVEYHLDGSGIEGITLMRADVVP